MEIQKKNTRARATREKIYNALIYLLKHKKFNEIYVKDICTIACIHRSSFYEHYQDINDLMIKTEDELSKKISSIFDGVRTFERKCFVELFEFIGEHSDFYNAYLNNEGGQTMGQTDFIRYLKTAQNAVGFNSDIEFHMAFFSGGLQAICKVWLSKGMQKTPEQMANIIFEEYQGKVKYFTT